MSVAGYGVSMDRTPPRDEHLWAEALWGLALMGIVLLLVPVIAALSH